MEFNSEFISYKNCCISTQDELKNECDTNDYSVVYTFDQTNGRGQYGAEWKIEKGKNIALSIKVKKFAIGLNSVELSMFVAVVVRAFVAQYLSEKVFIKWPNDIIVLNKKVAGILVETYKDFYIIGIGFNVNQSDFIGLPHATSFCAIKNETMDLHTLTKKFVALFFESITANKNEILPLYNAYLYKKGQVLEYFFMDSLFIGKLMKVNENGEIVLLKPDNNLVSYKHKSVTWKSIFD